MLFVATLSSASASVQDECPVCLSAYGSQSEVNPGTKLTAVCLSTCCHTVCNECGPKLSGRCPLCRKDFVPVIPTQPATRNNPLRPVIPRQQQVSIADERVALPRVGPSPVTRRNTNDPHGMVFGLVILPLTLVLLNEAFSPVRRPPVERPTPSRLSRALKFGATAAGVAIAANLLRRFV